MWRQKIFILSRNLHCNQTWPHRFDYEHSSVDFFYCRKCATATAQIGGHIWHTCIKLQDSCNQIYMMPCLYASSEILFPTKNLSICQDIDVRSITLSYSQITTGDFNVRSKYSWWSHCSKFGSSAMALNVSLFIVPMSTGHRLNTNRALVSLR